MMDLNLVVLSGRLAASPEVRVFGSGTRLIRYLVTVRSEAPRRRMDVVPVTLWEPTRAQVENEADTGDPIWVAGSLQRRFWESPDGRRSRIEVIAGDVQLSDADVRFTGGQSEGIGVK